LEKKHMRLAVRHFLSADESGATAIEYGLICAGIGLLILMAVGTTGEALIAALTKLLNAFG
jgi:Flp pilus assembly pilin Flp